jgi:hypothetical protein
MTMTKERVLENLKELVGSPFETDDIICAFGDFEEEGETNVVIKDSENVGYDAIAYIDSPHSTQFLFATHINADNEQIINDVWIA